MNRWLKLFGYANAIACCSLILANLIIISQYGIVYILTPFNEWIVEIPMVLFGIIILIGMMVTEDWE